MLEITRKITLDLARKSNTRLIFATQHDLNSRHLSITLTDDGRPYHVPKDCIVTMNVKRPDLSQKAFYCSVGDNGTVEYTIDSWVLAGDGEIKCSVSIYGQDHYKLTSSPFSLEVSPSLCLDSAIADDENLSLISSLMNEIIDVRESEQLRIAAEEERIEAEQIRESAEGDRIEAEARREHSEELRAMAEASRAEYREYVENRMSELEDQSEKNARRLTNIEGWIVYNPFVTDGTTAYSKDVPHDACPYAQIFEIGGMTKRIPVENLLKPPYYHSSGYTHNGITFTVSDDGTVTANGTKDNIDAPSIFFFSKSLPLDPYKSYRFIGAPASSANGGHYIIANSQRDTGSGATISGASNFNCHIIIENDVTVSDLQFKPVLYESDSSVEFSDLRKSAVHSVKIGCNNLFSLPYHDIAASLVGVSFNTAQDGTIALTGKCSLTEGYTSYHLMKGVTLPAGTYSISGCPSNGSNDTYGLLVNILHSDQTESYFSDMGNGVTFDIHEGDIIASISITVGYMLDLAEEIIFRPMLVKGPKAKEFHAHHQPKKLSIPSSVRKLDGYGDGISSQYYNKLVFNNENNDAKFVQVVARRPYQDGDEQLENVMTNGLETLYVLDEAVETVIEDNLLDGGLIEVEAGGYVSFENAINSDMPNRITYMIRGEIS